MPLQALYLTNENIENLRKVSNMSKLVNQLLSEYFKNNDINTMTEEELELRLKEIEVQEEFEKKIKQLREEYGREISNKNEN
jgi:predicted Holliday junction resolvase-like endonuclease